MHNRSLGRASFWGMALVFVGLASQVNAAYILTYQQSGSDVIASGSGSFNTSVLSLLRIGSSFDHAAIQPNAKFAQVGPFLANESGYGTLAIGPLNFGTGGLHTSTTGSGDFVSFQPNGRNDVPSLYVPEGYVSGRSLAGSATFPNSTFSSLGITPGTYTWTLTGGDTFTINASVPEPASIGLIICSCSLLMRRRRA
jgi:hypothetical protein